MSESEVTEPELTPKQARAQLIGDIALSVLPAALEAACRENGIGNPELTAGLAELLAWETACKLATRVEEEGRSDAS